jgi:hypothetical protein
MATPAGGLGFGRPLQLPSGGYPPSRGRKNRHGIKLPLWSSEEASRWWTAMRRAWSRVRKLAIAIGILIVGFPLSYAQAQNNQQNGQWCAYFTNGSTNCGFTTFEQCLEAIRGKTGLCDPNLQDVSPAPAQPTTQNNQQNGQWCAYFTDGPTNCGFAAFEQCLEAIRGKSGLCDHNPQYVSPAPAQP